MGRRRRRQLRPRLLGIGLDVLLPQLFPDQMIRSEGLGGVGLGSVGLDSPVVTVWTLLVCVLAVECVAQQGKHKVPVLEPGGLGGSK